MDRKTVVGLWKLSSEATIFGGSLIEQQSSRRSYVEFTVFKKVIFDRDNMTSTFTYSVTSDSTLEVIIDIYTVAHYSYSIQSNILTLIGGGCVDPCISKYKAVNSK